MRLTLIALVLVNAALVAGPVTKKAAAKEEKARQAVAQTLLKHAKACASAKAYDEALEIAELGLALVPGHAKLAAERDAAAGKASQAKDKALEKLKKERFEALQDCGGELVEAWKVMKAENCAERAEEILDEIDAQFTGEEAAFPVLLKAEHRQALLQEDKGEFSRVLCSEYYDFVSNGPDKEIAEFAQSMDLMYENYVEIFDHKEMPKSPFPIQLYVNQHEFMQKTGMPAGVLGFYDYGKIVAFHGVTGGMTTLDVLFHEGTHQFQGLVLGFDNMQKADTWFIEGLAVYFEASKVDGKKLKISQIPIERLRNVKAAMRADEYTPLAQLIRTPRSQFSAMQYAEAWSLIFFIIHGTKDGSQLFVEYFRRVQDGSCDGPETFEEIFCKPMDQIEAAWKDFVLKMQHP